MYEVPSEFIRQKTVIFWFVTVEQTVAGFLGYLLAETLGGSTLVTMVCVALGLIVTTVKAQGLTLYRFLPILIAYALRRVHGQAIEPEEGPAALPQASLTIRDADGNPIIYQES